MHDCLLFRRQLRFVGGNAMMRVSACQKGTAKRTTERETGHGSGKIHTCCSQIIDIRRIHVRIPIAAEGLRPMLISEHPDHIQPFACRFFDFRHAYLTSPCEELCIQQNHLLSLIS
jgi:hypothetical protein